MIDRQTVLEYLTKHPSHTAWQMRLHFLQANRQSDSHSSVSISSIANQLNYILRDIESIGTVVPPAESLAQVPDSRRGNRSSSRQTKNTRKSSIS